MQHLRFDREEKWILTRVFASGKLENAIICVANKCHHLQQVSVNWTKKSVGTQKEKQPKTC